ncbi:copper amine oxidase N-terminal domain-containing protein [Paenibacillus sp. GCM10012307]|uniref:Copper amine oxidase N-terminal domain-containing protein n=1 Tax=Paenibacillus roseus TaxID=2798579 RepID=A0A934MND9_9BACL|nr:copper amine oxidase N-terminal domain-containing protein [Paenibacillus roseus]MBJ6360911.1 copper amine oxidase N-terminal domain-containing protein [Paenibacillus roseus]
MKKFITTLMIAVLLVTFSSPTFAAQEPKLIVNGKVVTDVKVKTIKGTSYLPLRAIATVLGVEVTWHQASNTVIVGTGKEKANGMKKSSTARLIVNGSTISGVDLPSLNGVTYVPLRKVAQILGATVNWNAQTDTITITSSASSTTANIGVDSIKLALSKYGEGVTLSSTSLKTLNQHQKQFFEMNRDPLSLDKIAKATSEASITKSISSYYSSLVNLTFVEIDEISEVKMSTGQTVTVAIGHTGGKYNKMTESWTDSHYFQIFYLGSTKIKKGDGTTVNGLPVGQNAVNLVNELGVKFTTPMNVMIAGNFLRSIDEYDIRKARSESTGGGLNFPEEVNTINKQALENLSITLTNDTINITDDLDVGLKIKSISIMDYKYPINAPFELPNRYEGGLTISLSSFKNNQGVSFNGNLGEAYFVQIITDAGELTSFVSYE